MSVMQPGTDCFPHAIDELTNAIYFDHLCELDYYGQETLTFHDSYIKIIVSSEKLNSWLLIHTFTIEKCKTLHLKTTRKTCQST